MGLKITNIHAAVVEQILNKDTKIPQNPHLPLLKSLEQNRLLGAKAGYWVCPLHSPLTPEGMGETRKPPLQPNTWTYSYLPHVRNQLTPQQVSKQGNLFFFPPVAAGVPIKPCPNFFLCLEHCFFWLGQEPWLVSLPWLRASSSDSSQATSAYYSVHKVT